MVRRFKLRNQRRNVVPGRFRRLTPFKRRDRKFAVLTATGPLLSFGSRLGAWLKFPLGGRRGPRAAT